MNDLVFGLSASHLLQTADYSVVDAFARVKSRRTTKLATAWSNV